MKLRGRIVAFLLIVVLLASSMGFTTQGVLERIKLGLDLQGGFEVLYEVGPLKEGQKIDEEIVGSTAAALGKRVNALGVSEPSINVEGKNRIRVQLAGVDNPAKAREILSTSANLTFRDVNDEILLDGNDLKENGAAGSFDQQNRPIVTLTLKDAAKFAEVTTDKGVLICDGELVVGKEVFLVDADGEYVSGGSIIYRQRGTKIYPGTNAGIGSDDTVYAKVSGFVKFERVGRDKKQASVYPEKQQ